MLEKNVFTHAILAIYHTVNIYVVMMVIFQVEFA